MEREYLSHDERTDRRLASVLSIIRAENMSRCGIFVSFSMQRRWSNVQDPLTHIRSARYEHEGPRTKDES